MAAIIEYLQSYDDYFWQYEDQGKVIAVPGSHTIGYREHIFKEIILHLAPYGLPRFGSLLLAIAATNTQGKDTLDEIQRDISEFRIRGKISDEVSKGLWFAKLLTQLPDRYKKGTLRIKLLRAIFQNTHNAIGIQKSKSILNYLKRNGDTYYSIGDILNKKQLGSQQVINDFKTLSIIGRELNSVEAIMVRLSGLPELDNQLEELNVEVEKTGEEKGLIDQLLSNNTTYYVGALVTRLISGLHIPFHSTLPSDQPLGGVADITNKGNFDKLLMSEFAFDDHILMSRLANNESLYHHREAPPADNNYSRIILIDSTLKNWGTIKTLSFASMLAITNHPKNTNPCRVFVVGKSYQEISFSTVDEIINGLQLLDYTLDPGVGLSQLFTQEEIKRSEIFYIGTADSLPCPGMQLFMGELGKRIDHWIHPDANGAITVYKNPKRGKRFIQELRLPLKELWSKPKLKVKESSTKTFTNYPILFPHYNFKVLWRGQYQSYKVTKNKALLRLYQDASFTNKGWELITNNFQRKDNLRAVMTHNNLSLTVLVTDQGNKNFSLLNYPSGERIPITNTRNIQGAKIFSVEGGYFITSTRFRTSYIDLKGNVSEEKNTSETKLNEDKAYYTYQVYQNLTKIYINHTHQLVVGKHTLARSGSSLALIHNGNNNPSKVDSYVKRGDGFEVYVFPDGSTITHDRSGILILASSNKAIPEIYFPCVLGSPLGFATVDTFSGNSYYQKSRKVDLFLENLRGQQSMLTKLIKENLKISLKQAKEMTDSGLISSSKRSEMKILENEIAGMNCISNVNLSGIVQEVIEPNDFYNKYIAAFVNHIINGVKTK